MTYVDAVSAFKRELLTRTLMEHDWNRTRAARALGVQRTYLRKLIHDHGITVPAPRYAWPRKVA